jgi:linoleoyl-CoA desaturase
VNLSGGPLLHVMTGNLIHQIEHHIFPDIPSNRYSEIAPRVRAICERYGLRYTTGPLRKQYATVLRKINRYALPRRAETAAMRASNAHALAHLPVRSAVEQQPVRLAG